ncbi:hypothetical protein VC83_01194 [Pseudogymnoascus destructans]|uniref:RNA polymerase II holoenzyme cyclin-like subunit n=1 Tax=Pseudogymnoascus destructans TaxID=655981 RepID=A0A177ALK9_9PEZI|nr:uncharacterized protein VC83_01194 [Pseudogymnoascus destructans]OAF62201.1 hypothetical protein VC83_01194 [Pseudogymnoascus destructans]
MSSTAVHAPHHLPTSYHPPTISTTSRSSASRPIPPAAPSPPPHPSPSPPPLTASTPTTMANAQWLFSASEIANSPSVAAGLTPAEERARRAKGVNFIVQAGMLLKVPQVTLGSAAVFFQRFYMRVGMVGERGVHHYNIAATSLFLATKAEENCRKTKEIVIAVAKVAQKNANLVIDEQSKEFWRWKDSILLYEETMLELLTFDVVLESPYSHLQSILQQLGLEHDKALRNIAWAFLNDSQMTTMCLRMGPRDVAVAAVYFAARYNGEKIPDEGGRPWWVRAGGDEERIGEAVAVVQEFYAENPLGRTDLPLEGSPGGSAGELEATRERGGESPESVKEQGGEGGERSPTERTGAEAGDDDAVLKRVANDPATHERGDEAVTSIEGVPPKRKESLVDVDTGERDSKRIKSGDKDEREESEEGEVEE